MATLTESAAPHSPATEYRTRRDRFASVFASNDRRFRQLSNARLAIGLLGLVIAAVSIGGGWISAWWLFLPIAIFIGLAVLHDQAERERGQASRGVAFYESALARVEGKWAGKGHGDDDYSSPAHLYAGDLDLFGRGSLFELLNIARTKAGERKLADWLLASGEISVIRQRQQAVEALMPRLALRQEIALMGENSRSAIDRDAMAKWGAQPPVHVFQAARWVALVLALAFLITFVLFVTQYTGARPLLVAILARVVFSFSIRSAVNQIAARVAGPATDLALLAHFLDKLEAERSLSPHLIVRENRSPSSEIRKLQKWVERLDWSRNQFFMAISLPLLWIPQCAIAIETWRQRCGPHIGEWVHAVAEFEALNCLAGFAYEHPDAVFPELIDQAPIFSGVAVKHPLIAGSNAVGNDVELSRACPLWIISGSNMSGKSTLLRAVGLNTVLAWAGAPVCCAKLRISPLRIGASIRVNDSLNDNQSRFYAEITRLRAVVQQASVEHANVEHANVEHASEFPASLFLLDELLSGTNSHDRRIGATAVVRGLVERGAIGMVTTHDLALAEIADALGPRARNVHFEEHMEAGKMLFDYRLKSGVVERSNALELMRAVGLDV